MWKDDAKSDVKYDLYLNDKKKETDLKASSYTFKELEVNTKYTIKLVAKNSYNKTKEISATFSTKDYPSPTASTLIFKDYLPASRSIVLDWSTNANIIYPNIIVDNNEQIELRNGEQSYVIEDLESDSEHFITFSASLNTGRTYYRYYKIRTDASK